MNELLSLDAKLFHHINTDWCAGFLDTLMPLCSNVPLFWSALAAALLCLVLASCRRADMKRRLYRILTWTIIAGICAGATDVTAAAVKLAVGRLRPHQSLALVRHHVDATTGWVRNVGVVVPEKKRGTSFFSGHAANTMAVAAATAVMCPPATPYVYILPLVVGYSRVYLGKHYPSDVLAGWLVGWCIATTVSRRARRWFRL